MGPVLTELTIGDDPEVWVRAGFTVTDTEVRIGDVTLRLQAPGSDGPRGIIDWAFDGLLDGTTDGTLDGVATRECPCVAPDDVAGHPNGVTGVDHVVVMTDDLDRTSGALQACGFEPRRRRAVPASEPPRSQIFWWAGPVIIELVGPDAATGDGPASLWGLALTTPDLDTAGELLGDLMSTPRDAVQPGRRIAGLRGRALDLSVPIALMTPHV